MSQIINSDVSYTGLVEKYIGTAYDNVKAVADHIDAVVAVSQMPLDTFDTIAGIAPEIEIVAAIAAEVVIVANMEANIATVIADEVDIGIVATNIADVITCANNIVDIQNAAANAQLAIDNAGYATEWANNPEDTLVSAAAGGDQVDDYSALHSAIKASGSLTDFETRYLGSFASPPVLDNDGFALIDGAMYWDSALQKMRVWSLIDIEWKSLVAYGIIYLGLWEIVAGSESTEYPTDPVEDGFYVISNDIAYEFTTGDLVGQTAEHGNYLIWENTNKVWELTGGLIDTSILLHKDGSVPVIAPLRFQDEAGAQEMAIDYSSLIFAANNTFSIYGGAPSPEKGLHITENGNVGIGEVTPEEKLHISAGSDSFAVFGPNALTAKLLVGAGSTDRRDGVSAQVLVTAGNLLLDAGGTGKTYLNSYAATDVILCNNGGNVGIGVAVPTTKLHVDGPCFIDGSLTAIEATIRDTINTTDIFAETITMQRSDALLGGAIVGPNNVWKTAGISGIEYRKLPDGTVEIRNTSVGPFTGNLPSGHLPSKHLTFIAVKNETEMMTLIVNSDGSIIVVNSLPVTQTFRFYADGS